MVALQTFERKWKEHVHGQEHVLQGMAPVNCCRWWEIQHEYSFREARDSRKGQEVVEVIVKHNLSHMEPPLCSGVIFQL
jgi:hypothetical protein